MRRKWAIAWMVSVSLFLCHGTSYAEYVDNGNGTVTDTSTGLIWQQATAPGIYTWQEALAFCENLILGDRSDWRLPTKKELRSLGDYSRYNPAINITYFPNTQSSGYWSSTTEASNTHCAYILFFSYGGDSYGAGKDIFAYVRAVRGGQYGSLGNSVIAMSPVSGPPGTAFSESGSGFTPNSMATLHFKKPDGTESPTLAQPIDANGHFETSYVTPFDEPAGTYNWWGIDGVTGNSSNHVSYEITTAREGLTRFAISAISSPKQVNAGFNVTISALDQTGQIMAGFNQWVQLKSSSGDNGVSPRSVLMNNGEWTGPVTFFNGGVNMWLEVRYSGINGRSNVFTVTGGNPIPGGISGVIKDTNKNWLTGVNIELFGGGNDFRNTFSGTYHFNNVPPGLYTLTATHQSSGESITLQNIRIQPFLPIYQPICISINAAEDKIPILLVPGIMGSARNGDLSIFPGLPQTQGEVGSLHLHNPGSTDPAGWKKLTDKLITAHYEGDKTLFTVPYDWRMDIDDIVDLYLIPAINDAKLKTGKDKVSIIAHSMGGLVVRAYIQGNHNYNSNDHRDIYRFAMVGTPNKGASSAYYMWEGGDPLLVDNICSWGVGPGNFYSNTTQKNCDITLGYKPWVWEHSYIRAYYHGEKGNEPITGIKQLLPTYEFLGRYFPKNLTYEVNTFLKDLNNADTTAMGKPGEPDKIETVIFAGDSEPTIYTIDVGAPNRYYVDGVPQPADEDSAELTSAGDGTVRKNSALLPFDEGWAASPTPETGEHAGLVKTYADALVEFIDTGVVSTAALKVAQPLEAEPVEPILSVSVTGPVRALLENPEGLASGIHPESGDYENAIPGADMTQLADGGYIAVTSPQDGQYSLHLTGTAASDYTLELNFSGETADFYISHKGFNSENTVDILLEVNSADAEKIKILNLPLPPENLNAQSFGPEKQTRLTWSPATGETLPVVGYTIYSKTMEEPRFYPIGTTAGTVFDTGHPWALNIGEPDRIYYVSAVLENDVEGFFSESVVNAGIVYDLDESGQVDIVDIMKVAARWNTATGDPNYDASCDLDGDGDIDIIDVMKVAAQWGWTAA